MFSLAFRTFFAILKSIGGATFSLDFTTGVLDPKVTFTRSTTGTYVGSNGLIQTAAINTPRFDYDPVTSTMRGLLVEDARTNVILQSQGLNVSPWIVGSATITANATTAPDGTMTGSTLSSTAANGYTYQPFTTAATGSIYSASVYAKTGTTSGFTLYLYSGTGPSGIYATFDLSNGTVGAITTSGGAGNQNAYIENAGNGWYKCTVVTSCAASTSYYPQALLPTVGTSIYLWGMQVEVGDTSSSYIPTTTSTVTRSNDIAEVNSISSFYNSEASTLFFQGIPTATLLSPLQNCVALHDKSYTGPLSNGAFQNRMNLARYYFGAGIGVVTAQGTNTLLDIEPIWPAFTLGKIAMSCIRNKQLSCINGTTPGSNTAVTIPNAATTLTIGSRPVDNLFAWRGRIQKVEYYNTALNEAQLKALTGGWVESDPYWSNVSLLLQADGPANARTNNVFLDGSANALSVSRSGNVTQGSISPFTKTYPYNVNLGGGSIYVNGVPGNNLIVASSVANAIGTGQFTIEAWVYIISGKSTPTGNGAHTVISQGNNASNLMWMLGINDSTRTIFWGLSADVAVTVSGSPITFNAWNHIAVTRNAANSEKIFLNGAVINTRTNTSNYNNASSYQIQVGSHYDTNYPSAYGISSYGNVLNGYISNLRVVPGVAVYTGAFTPPTTPLAKSQVANAVSSIGAITEVAPPTTMTITPNSAIDYLVVAGGGSGGNRDGGGGGAGGYLTASAYSVTAGIPMTVTVGSGGAALVANTVATGNNGTNSSFAVSTAIGGGGGGYYSQVSGLAGGSGGGGGNTASGSSSGGAGTAGQGNAGGGASGGTPSYAGGGGGGAGAVGGAGSASAGGIGGVGLASSITGTSTYYAGGGGGGTDNTGGAAVGGAGGSGGGGQGGYGNSGSGYVDGVNGTVNTGGGGGGAGWITASGAGGSGVVIIRQADTNPVATTTGSPTITTSGGYRIYKFTASGTITFGNSTSTTVPFGLETLVVAGGGGAGHDVGGGGGGGGLLYSASLPITAFNTYTVTVGTGGGSSQGSGVKGSSGTNSSFNTLVSIGGGGGGSYSGNGAGLSGGSGGGGGDQNASGGAGTAGQGNAGGSSVGTWGSGGGGGAGGAGATGVLGTNVLGGLGASYSISGTTQMYAGGGYGNSDGGTVQPTGQNYAGAVLGTYGYGANGTGIPNSSSYNGNSGIVIIKHPDSVTTAITTGSPTVVTSGGYTTYTFTSSGTIRWGSSPTGLLLNGVNAAIVDTTGNNVLETVGDAQISTSVRQYGTGSLKFDGTGDWLSFAPNAGVAFGTGDFTIECWLNSNNVSSANQLGILQISDTAGGLKASYSNSIAILQGYSTSTAITGALTVNINGTFYGTSGAVITTGTWYHFALTRASGALKMFVNGTIVVNSFDGSNIPWQNLVVGGIYNTSYLYNGYLDDVRITKGVARYTTAFTPPVSALPFIPRAADATATPVNNLNKSLRFRSSASAYLNRTPAVAGNRRTFTISYWIKRGTLGTSQYLFAAGSGTTESTFFDIAFDNNGASFDASGASTWTTSAGSTTAVFRDPAAWYHFVWAVDTTQAVASDRSKIYVNGVLQTPLAIAVAVTQNADLAWNNSGVVHYIGARIDGGPRSFFDGEMAEINSVDGQALAPTAFGGFSTYDQWMPKAYTGTYGTNGFYLPFTNTTSTSTLVADSSGNGNNWTPNNISLTAGYTYDSMTDVPTRTSVTAGNYGVLSPLSVYNGGGTLSNGNLSVSYGTIANNKPTMVASTGKWYAEFTCVSAGGHSGTGLSILTSAAPNPAATALLRVEYYNNGQTYNYNTSAYVSYGAAWTNGDVIGVAWDCDAAQVTFYKNGVSQGTLSSPSLSLTAGGSPISFIPSAYNTGVTSSFNVNYGQQPWAYTKPTGFLALNSYNTSTIPMLFPAAPSIMPPAIETLVVAGGAGGGGWGGGGGAGGLIHDASYTVASGSSYTVTVGAGGIAGTQAYTDGGNGSYSRLGTMTADGGGGGGHYAGFPGRFGGSGGGGGGNSVDVNQAGGYGIVGQGNAGGIGGGLPGSYHYGHGGGGGAGAVGANYSGYQGGAGGVGLAYSISGTSTYYAGGGGGETPNQPGGYSPGAGGLGGGGAGGTYSNGINATSGTANTGGGGGGGYTGIGTGGSGVVIIRYLDSYLPASATTGSPIYTVANGYRVYKFTGSGTITF